VKEDELILGLVAKVPMKGGDEVPKEEWGVE
jgi:hypothetical protein